MERPLRVLVVGTSTHDAELMIHALHQGGLNPTCERVETAEALATALATGTWDVVLSDHTLEGSDADACLGVTRAIDPDLPCPVVSGPLGEDVAMTRTEAHCCVAVPAPGLVASRMAREWHAHAESDRSVLDAPRV